MKVAKAEIRLEMNIGLNPKYLQTMGVWSPNSEQERVKRLSRKRVEPQAIGGRNELPLLINSKGEEII